MQNLYENKFMKKLQRLGEMLASNKAFSSISNGMMACMGAIMVGAFFQIIAVIPTIFKWVTTDSAYYKFCMTPYNMTMGLIAIVVVFAVAYNYAKLLDLKPLVNALNALLLFLMVASPSTTVTLADGKATFTGLDTTSLGAPGIFTAIIIALLSIRITYTLQKHHIAIKMPDAVPQFLQDSFSALIPFVVNVLVWHGLNTICIKILTIPLPYVILAILAKPISTLTSIPGMIICMIIATLLWSFGIHGSMIIYAAMAPLLMQYVTSNAALVADGKSAVFAPIALFGAMLTSGGTGNPFALVIMGLRSKSKQLKAVGKAGIIPILFNINEPTIFGFPIMYNPLLAIPYILNPIFVALAFWGLYAINFFKPAYIMVSGVMPLGVAEFLGAMSWQNIFMPVVAFLISYVIYLPFFKVYEKQLIDKEEEAEQAEA